MSAPLTQAAFCRHGQAIPCPTCRQWLDIHRTNGYRPTHEWEKREYDELVIGAGEVAPAAAPLVRVQAPKLAQIGERHVSMIGWSLSTVTDHLKTHLVEEEAEEKWCSVDCMARTMFQRKTDANVKRVRERIRGLFRALLEQGEFMVIRYDNAPSGRGRILACKLLRSENDEREMASANIQLERMHGRKEVSDEVFRRALSVIDAKRGTGGAA